MRGSLSDGFQSGSFESVFINSWAQIGRNCNNTKICGFYNRNSDHPDENVLPARGQEARELEFEAMFCHQCDDSLAGHRSFEIALFI